MKLNQLYKGVSGRLLLLLAACLLPMAVLVFRLWHEQLRLGRRHREAISRQSIRRIRVAPVRGRIFSCDNVALVDNVPSYDVFFHIHEMRQPGRGGRGRTVAFVLEQIQHAAAVVGRSTVVTVGDVQRHMRVYPALPFKAFAGLSPEELSRLYDALPPLPGLEVTPRMLRVYPQHAVGAQLLGFVGRRDPATEEERRRYAYFLPELSGRAGLEQAFDRQLRGRGGARMVRVDCLGFFHEEIARTWASQRGNDLFLTIDSRAQRIAQELLRGVRGALVLLDSRNGAVRAMVSAPTYDLNHLSRSRYAALAADRAGRPLLDRALAAGYMPGSIIKPLMAMCVLEAGLVTPDETITCEGGAAVGHAFIRCANRLGHGPMDVVSALEASCNTYFIRIVLRAGIDRVTPFLAAAGIGRRLGLELPGGGTGVLPSRKRLRQREGRAWTAFDTALIAIGQGAFAVSPLQAAVFTAAIANGGTVYRPHLVAAIKDPQGQYLQAAKRDVLGRLPVSMPVLAVVREGMEQVVHGPHASAPAARTPVIPLAGKTGTAEVGTGANKRKNTWFVCFGPVAAPRYALAVLVEDGVSGGKTAAPLARRFFEAYLRESPRDASSLAAVSGGSTASGEHRRNGAVR